MTAVRSLLADERKWKTFLTVINKFKHHLFGKILGSLEIKKIIFPPKTSNQNDGKHKFKRDFDLNKLPKNRGQYYFKITKLFVFGLQISTLF